MTDTLIDIKEDAETADAKMKKLGHLLYMFVEGHQMAANHDQRVYLLLAIVALVCALARPVVESIGFGHRGKNHRGEDRQKTGSKGRGNRKQERKDNFSNQAMEG